jgi:general stress protein 26
MLELSYDTELTTFLALLDKATVWVLATSENDHVTSRSMSVVHLGTDIFFQTHNSYLKHRQMQHNSNVALCNGNYSVEGSVECLGSWRRKIWDYVNGEPIRKELRLVEKKAVQLGYL